MLNSFSRTELLLGHPAMEALKHARVAVFGIGGVGGYAARPLSAAASAPLTSLTTTRSA